MYRQELVRCRNTQRLHFAIEMAAFEAQGGRGLCHVPAVFLQLAEYELAFVGTARFVQGGVWMLRTVRDSAEKFGRKVMWLNARLRANNHEALNEIAHLAHIPRPGIAQEDVHGRSAQLASLLAVGRTEFVEEIAGQRGDVLLALSQ